MAAVAIPRLTGFQATAKYKSDIATAKTIATAAITEMSTTGASTVALTALTDYFDGAIVPKSALDGTTDFVLTTASGGVTSVKAHDVTLYPNPAAATPSAYK